MLTHRYAFLCPTCGTYWLAPTSADTCMCPQCPTVSRFQNIVEDDCHLLADGTTAKSRILSSVEIEKCLPDKLYPQQEEALKLISEDNGSTIEGVPADDVVRGKGWYIEAAQ